MIFIQTHVILIIGGEFPVHQEVTMTGESILIVEDDGVIALRIHELLTKAGYQVSDPVAFGEDAIELIARAPPDLVLMDIELMGYIDGIETARQIRQRSDIPVIYLTAYADDRRLAQVKETAPYGYIVKPFMDRELLATIDMALHRHKIDVKLKEREHLYRAVVDNVSEIIILFDSETRTLLEVNPAFFTVLGYAKPDVPPLVISDILAGTPEETRIWTNGICSGQWKRGEGRLKCRDGTIRSFEIAASVITRRNGNTLISMIARELQTSCVMK